MYFYALPPASPFLGLYALKISSYVHTHARTHTETQMCAPVHPSSSLPPLISSSASSLEWSPTVTQVNWQHQISTGKLVPMCLFNTFLSSAVCS